MVGIELIALKDEFLNHQKNIDEYYSLTNEVEHMQNDIPIGEHLYIIRIFSIQYLINYKFFQLFFLSTY